MAGEEFDSLLRARFGTAVIKAAEKSLKKIRAKYEGLSGFLYVDAGAYASQKGTKGCKEAAPKHRTNALKFVLGMKRCASCTKQGDGVCQEYNKILVSKPPVKNPKAYQKKAIYMANAPDQEVTASLFTDPSTEFQLGGTHMDDIQLEDVPSTKTLSNVVFGGMEVDLDT